MLVFKSKSLDRSFVSRNVTQAEFVAARAAFRKARHQCGLTLEQFSAVGDTRIGGAWLAWFERPYNDRPTSIKVWLYLHDCGKTPFDFKRKYN